MNGESSSQGRPGRGAAGPPPVGAALRRQAEARRAAAEGREFNRRVWYVVKVVGIVLGVLLAAQLAFGCASYLAMRRMLGI